VTDDQSKYADAVLERVSNMDSRVTGVEAGLTSIRDDVHFIRSDLRNLMHKLSEPKQVNFAGWAAVLLTLIGGLFWQDSRQQQFVELSLRPIRSELAERQSADVSSQNDRVILNRTSTENSVALMYHRERQMELAKDQDAMRSRLSELEEIAARCEERGNG
jgi:hypothetical protein